MNTLMLIIALVEWRAADTSLLSKGACIGSFFIKRLSFWRRVLALVALSVPEQPPPDNCRAMYLALRT